MCPVCEGAFCRECNLKSHPNVKTCEEARRLDGFDWDMIGDGEDGRANRCPKCNSPFEKASGCMHMTCAVCAYEWCWVCGLPFHSVIHYGQFGGVVCEMIGSISFKKRSTCRAIMLYTLVFLGLPFIVFFMSAALAIAMCFVGIFETCLKNKMSSFWSKRNVRLSRSLRCFQCPLKALIITSYILFLIVLIILLITIGCIFTVLSTAFFMIPTILLYLFVVIRKNFVWSNHNDKNSSKKATVNQAADQEITAEAAPPADDAAPVSNNDIEQNIPKDLS